MSINHESQLQLLISNILTLKNDINDFKYNLNLDFLENLLEGESLTSKIEPSVLYNYLEDYKDTSETIRNEFFTELEDLKKFYNSDTNTINYILGQEDGDAVLDCIDRIDETTCNEESLNDITFTSTETTSASNKKQILQLKYDILKNNIEILRTYINAEKDALSEKVNMKKSNQMFANTLNDDYSEIYKYRYLRNWGIFLSILGGVYFFKKMK